jgi:catechol 2,3-dioxygenase-like lactoylglutathione lyase family enzyme
MLEDAPVIAMIPTKDLAKARKFYEQTLGLTQAEEMPRGVSFRCGDGSRIAVYETYVSNLGEQTVAAWEVKDIKSQVAELKSRGVEFLEYDLPQLKTVDSIVAEEGFGSAAWFKDADGNILSLVQRQT